MLHVSKNTVSLQRLTDEEIHHRGGDGNSPNIQRAFFMPETT